MPLSSRKYHLQIPTNIINSVLPVGLKMLQRTVSHISESILIAALICRVLCVTIKKTNSKIQNCRLCIVGPASGWRPGGDPKSFVKKHIPVVLSTCQ